MRVISHEVGQILYLISTDEVRPIGGTYAPDVIAEIARRYSFVVVPTDIVEAVKNGIKFAMGKYELSSRDIQVQKIELYNDGIVIATSISDDTDLVLDDFTNWLVATYKFRFPRTVRKRYSSQMVVDFERPLERLLSPANALIDKYRQLFKEQSGLDVPVQLMRISLAADPETVPQYLNTQLLFERRLGASYELNRYMCGAPLPTTQHISLLQTLDSLT